MVSLLSFSFIGISLFIIVAVQAKPWHEPLNTSKENKSSSNYQEIFEIYKAMREDPRLKSVSNHDIVLYIYRNFVFGTDEDTDSIKQKHHHRHQQQQQQTD